MRVTVTWNSQFVVSSWVIQRTRIEERGFPKSQDTDPLTLEVSGGDNRKKDSRSHAEYQTQEKMTTIQEITSKLHLKAKINSVRKKEIIT